MGQKSIKKPWLFLSLLKCIKVDLTSNIPSSISCEDSTRKCDKRIVSSVDVIIGIALSNCVSQGSPSDLTEDEGSKEKFMVTVVHHSCILVWKCSIQT